MTHAVSASATLDLHGVLTALGIEARNPGTQASYTVIRGHDGPRWLIPQQGSLARTILKEWRPYGLLTRLAWLAVPAASRLGALPLLPGSARAQLPADAADQFLRRAGMRFEAAPPVVLVGNDSDSRKLLVFLEDRSEGKIVLAKVPLKPMAYTSIRNEAGILASLPERLHAPRVLHVNEEAAIALQEYLPGRLGSRHCKPQYVELLIQLAETGGKISLRERRQQLAERLRAHGGYGKDAAPLDAALALLDRDETLPAVLVHGDFAPWNIRELPDGACTLIDWEMARRQSLPLHDLCHFYFMQARLFTPETLFYRELLANDAWRIYMRGLGLHDSLLKPLAAAFLLEMLARYWEGAETSASDFCLSQLRRFSEDA